MKRTFLSVLTLLFSVAATDVFSQVRKPQWEIFAGAAIPLKPDLFKDYYKVGGSIHGQYVMFPSNSLGISFGIAAEGFTVDKDKILSDFGLVGSGVDITANASIVELGVGVRPYITPPEANSQFFLFGMATYNALTEEATVTFLGQEYGSKETANKFGLAAGAGFELPAGEKINILLQGLMRFIFTEEENTSFLGITGGIVF